MTVHLGTGAVVSDGRQIARIEDSGSTVTAGEVSLTPTICSIQCEQALPALQCLAVLAVFADCRMHDSMKGDFGGAGSDAVLDRPVVGR